MILVIRIAGEVDINSDVAETLFRMRLRKKYTAVLLQENEQNKYLIESVRNFVAFGKIDDKTLAELIEKRGDKKKKDNTVFHLHPPRKGIDSKIHFGKRKGVLGDNGEKINELVRRML
jgi:large subunit ribosomal protein L30